MCSQNSHVTVNTWMRIIPAVDISTSNKCCEGQELGPEEEARKIGRKGGGDKNRKVVRAVQTAGRILHEKPLHC